MGAFTSVAVAGSIRSSGEIKQAIIAATGPASYDSDGSVLDLSTTTLGAWDGFTKVYGCTLVGYTAAADTQYHGAFVIGSSGDPATGKVVLYDLTGGVSGANVGQASGSVAVVFYFLVTGR